MVVLQSLHSAHQGCTGMQSWASESIYWPGLILTKSEIIAKHVSPTQSKEPIILSPLPQYPFQIVTADYYVVFNHHYLTVDCDSGWICVFHSKNKAISAWMNRHNTSTGFRQGLAKGSLSFCLFLRQFSPKDALI